MKFRGFQHNYHDGHLVKFTLGPRQELTLEIDLDPVWNKEPSSALVRFGGIKNFAEVTAFFQTLPQRPHPDAYIAEIIGLRYSGEGPNWIVVDLAAHGHVNVHSHHVTEL